MKDPTRLQMSITSVLFGRRFKAALEAYVSNWTSMGLSYPIELSDVGNVAFTQET